MGLSFDQSWFGLLSLVVFYDDRRSIAGFRTLPISSPDDERHFQDNTACLFRFHAPENAAPMVLRAIPGRNQVGNTNLTCFADIFMIFSSARLKSDSIMGPALGREALAWCCFKDPLRFTLDNDTLIFLLFLLLLLFFITFYYYYSSFYSLSSNPLSANKIAVWSNKTQGRVICAFCIWRAPLVVATPPPCCLWSCSVASCRISFSFSCFFSRLYIIFL